LSYAENLPEGELLPVGLDLEWNVGATGKQGRVPLIQLAFKIPYGEYQFKGKKPN
jgi:hypothetical protein